MTSRTKRHRVPLEAEMLSLGDLTDDPDQLRVHTPRNIGTIATALQQVGAARSIVIDEDGMTLAGHGVREAAAEVGIEKVLVVDADGETLVAVRRRGLTREQKTVLAAADNLASDQSRFNPELVLALKAADHPAAGLWTAEELAALATAAEPAAPAEFPAVDENVPTEHRCPRCGYEWSGKG